LHLRGEEVRGGWRKVHNEELQHVLIFYQIKGEDMRGCVVNMGKKTRAYRT